LNEEIIYNTTKAEKNNFVILSSIYNKEEFLYDWSRSILAQTYRPLNVVAVNDKSKDESFNTLLKLSDDFKNNNIGFCIINSVDRMYCSSSYKKATEFASFGNYFGVLDADDMLVPGAVEFITSVYKKHPDIGHIFSQFQICDVQMNPKKVGFCTAPPGNLSLLDMGVRRMHSYSHWRTFSNRIPINKVFPSGLKVAVDKYMGYRLEELGPGAFVNKVCYLYREGAKNSITCKGKSKIAWRKIVIEAIQRRKRFSIKPFKVVEL